LLVLLLPFLLLGLRVLLVLLLVLLLQHCHSLITAARHFELRFFRAYTHNTARICGFFSSLALLHGSHSGIVHLCPSGFGVQDTHRCDVPHVQDIVATICSQDSRRLPHTHRVTIPLCHTTSHHWDCPVMQVVR
jgi:hypothetical protein